MVGVLASRGADVSAQADVNAPDHQGRTALHETAREHDLSGAQWLLDHGADALASDAAGETPLHFAAGSGDTQLASLLLAHGADIHREDNSGVSPIELAASLETPPDPQVV